MTLRTSRLKNVADVVVSNVDKHSIVGEPAVKLCNYVDVYKNTYIDSTLQFMDSTASAEQVRRYGLRAGDVILTKDSETPFDIAVPALVTEDVPGLICGYHLAVIRAHPRKINPRFLLRAFQSKTTARYFTTSANGITRYGLTYYSLRNAPIPVPTLSEQEQIADFLDRETAEADALVAKYERLIELLEEKRVALITQAVTKGLDPSVPMKDSGVEWFGSIPAHWEIGHVRRYYSVVDCKHVTVDFEDDGIPVVSVREVKRLSVSLDTANKTSERWFNVMVGGGRLPRRGDVIFCRNVSPGTCAYVDTDERFAMGQDVCLIRDHDADGKYFNYLMRSDFMHTQMGLVLIGSTFNRINVSTIESLLVHQPNREEKTAIVSWLDDRLALLDDQSEKVKKAIRLVQEHRSALITAAVTGQINVNTYRSKNQSVEVSA